MAFVTSQSDDFQRVGYVFWKVVQANFYPGKSTRSFPSCFPGLLNLNEPQRDKPLLARNEDEEDCEDGETDDGDEEGTVASQCSTSIEEHFIEHLPPTLHKGDSH